MVEQQDNSIVTEKLQQAKDGLSSRLLELSQRGQPATEIAYNVVFTGKFSVPQEQALQSLSAFFKQGTENTRRLLQAGRVLKSYPDKAPADKLARLLARAGAECRVEMETSVEEAEPNALQRAAFALDAVKVPLIRLPDVGGFGRKQWIAVGGAGVLCLAVLLWLLLKPPVIGGDTRAEYEASIERVIAHEKADRQQALRRAITLLTEATAAAQQESATTDENTAARLIYAPVVGKTGKQILEKAEARLESQREAYRQGLAEADNKIAEADRQLAALVPDNQRVLDRIVVSDASFGWPEAAHTPTLAFVITNNSSETLMRVFLQGYLYDEQGTLLTSNAVTYAVAGGLAPGRSASVSLPTLSDSPWASAAVREHPDRRFTLRVANAENLRNQQLGKDYRPLENEKLRQQAWKRKTQAALNAMTL